MGKVIDARLKLEERRKQQGSNCEVPTAPICECCSLHAADTYYVDNKNSETKLFTGIDQKESNDVQELVIIGAGPHALSLLLRLLEPEPDLLSDKERHLQADYRQRMRPLGQVRRHVRDLLKGPKATLRQNDRLDPPFLSPDMIKNKVTVIDASGSKWMATWDQNFSTLDIPHLRSPIAAHADPYDHRALEFFADHQKRSDELIDLNFVPKKIGRWDFHGPYNVPSTSVFSEFHKKLTEAYGIADIVKNGRVQSIKVRPPLVDSGEPLFDLEIIDRTGRVSTVTTKRVVCAMGPATSAKNNEFLWEETLRQQILSNTYGNPAKTSSMNEFENDKIDDHFSRYVLHTHDIIPWLVSTAKQPELSSPKRRILIVGGGITSGHLALLASNPSKSPWCSSVALIQRSQILERQFDIPTQWMGPARGKLQDEFRSLPPEARVKRIKEERRGGSISPEVLKELKKREQSGHLNMKVEVEIESVEFVNGALEVFLSDDSVLEVDMIWLATGFAINVSNYPCLHDLQSVLPIETVHGLPVLNPDLSWGTDDQNTPESWKTQARKRLWIMGALAGLELGPDALNLMGARQGAVRVAQAILADLGAP